MSLALYRKVLEQMWSDGVITPDELTTLADLQGEFNLSAQDAAEAEQGILGRSMMAKASSVSYDGFALVLMPFLGIPQCEGVTKIFGAIFMQALTASFVHAQAHDFERMLL